MPTRKRLIYSWNDKDFKWTKEDLQSVYYNLKKLGYCLSKEEPENYMLKVIDNIVEILLGDKWVMLLCNSHKLLSELANYIPVTYSLNSMFSCMNVNSNDVYKTIYEGTFDDSALNELKLVTLLYWNNILEVNPNAVKYTGGFFDLISMRANRKCSTVLTHLYTGTQAPVGAMKNIEIRMSQLFGEGTTSIIREKITIIDIPARENNLWGKINKISI